MEDEKIEMTISEQLTAIFEACIVGYHRVDRFDVFIPNPFPDGTIHSDLWHKCLIDTRQWHMEDVIRDPEIEPVKALELKRLIDRSNQERTDMVERIDEYYRNKFANVEILPDAKINTETPAWAIDRLSILMLKIYHMCVEVERTDASEEHIARCRAKLAVLREQQKDLSQAIDELMDDIAAGRKYMKVYKQMKMYNDADTNPVLYAAKK